MENATAEHVKVELERMRARLLDLSARNPLLNYRHPRASSLRVVDEVPAIVLERLVNNIGFRFAALDADVTAAARGQRATAGQSGLLGAGVVDDESLNDDLEPSQSDRARREAARELRARREALIRSLAEQHGINPSYDLPAVGDSEEENHADGALQTLLLPEELEARLQKMQAAAVTAIQESGANTLHLLFGFVEWADVEGGTPRLAPLVLLPATLSRLDLDYATHTYPYTVFASGEDWSTNVTLQEKCRKDFGFVLPSIEAEENLEAYFGRVEEVLRNGPVRGWKLRRQLTLGLVSFGKILMWRDLDPATWPTGRTLMDNTLFREVLGGDDEHTVDDDENGAILTTTEYNIDRLPPEYGEVPPIVVPADSSQHSVLVDVQRGSNLVVQGPPGTGKSQTITNIVADAIAAGKKVLFVAEKKAALEVVARRLTDAGLGPFCLPLHSHTTNKREFLDQLDERIKMRDLGDAEAELHQVEQLLHDARDVLTGHCERLHEPFGSLGDTAFTLMWRARRLASEVPDDVIERLRGVTIPNATRVTAVQLARERAKLSAFAAAHEDVLVDIPHGGRHPWVGVTRSDLTFDDAQALIAIAVRVRGALEAAERARLSLVALTDGVPWHETPTDLATALTAAETITSPALSTPDSLIEAIYRRTGEGSVRAAVEAADGARVAWARISGPWRHRGAISLQEYADYRRVAASASEIFTPEVTIAEAAAIARGCTRALGQLDALRGIIDSLTKEVALRGTPNLPFALRLLDTAARVVTLPDPALDLRSPAMAVAGANDQVRALRARADALRKDGVRQSALFEPALRPDVRELRQMVGAFSDAPAFLPFLFSAGYRRAASAFRRMSGGKKAPRGEMASQATALLRHLVEKDTFVRDPAIPALFGPWARGLETPFDGALAVIEWCNAATGGAWGFGDLGRSLTEAVWNAPSAAWREAAGLAVADPRATESARSLPATITDVEQWTHGSTATFAQSSLDALSTQLRSWKEAAEGLEAAGRAGGLAEGSTVLDLTHLLDGIEQARARDSALEAHRETFRELGLAPGADTVDDEAIGRVRDALHYLSQFHAGDLPAAAVLWLATGDIGARVPKLREAARRVKHAVNSALEVEKEFAEAAGADLDVWYGKPDAAVSLSDRVARLDRAIQAGPTLGRYITWLRERHAVHTSSMPAAVVMLESGAIDGAKLPDVYSYLLSRTLCEAALRQRPELDRFSGALHENRRSQFAALDERFIQLTRKKIAGVAARTPRIPGVGYGQVRDLTEESLIRHEIGKTRRHIPIREMFRRAGRSIQALKPCVMMGPQAVAQYLPPGLFHFDLVVMDEASQMRPEDALGAIARGSQLVVVGDPKQLGPTSFFDVQSSDDDDVEEAAAQLAAQATGAEETSRGASVLERSESILLAAARRYPMRMLRWHYRSRYPQLISFSNAEFYGGDLVLFPHPGAERTGDGVNFRAVEGALYAGRINRAEAELVVHAVREHAAAHPERSLLVATMNQPQRELIDRLIQEAEKDDPRLAAFRARHESTLEPFSVKNLENVQGDERDTIFVSVTYGPDDRGVVAQNFGPVNAVGGERRLNVLFTRAKFRLDVFCSFDPVMLRVTEDSPRGLCVFRDYLRFAMEGILAGGRFTGKEPDSDFEVEVARAIRAAGFDVHVQVGVAGYFLDMAVVDPERPGRYMMAVECDGATYHSAKSARDRDRLRQQVLEGLGWSFHRIWSTDWFRDPNSELQKLVARIDAATARNAQSSGPQE